MELLLMSHSYCVHEVILWLSPEYLSIQSEHSATGRTNTGGQVQQCWWMPLKLILLVKNLISKQYHLPGGIAQVSAYIKYLMEQKQ